MKTNKFRSKWISIVLVLCAMLVVAACGKTNTPNNETPTSTTVVPTKDAEAVVEKLNVVTSFYPIYYLATEIGGEHVQVDNLIAAGIEPHDWTPKSQDLNKASKAELFLYHGAGLETWVDDFLKGLSSDSGVVTKEMSLGIPLINSNAELIEEAHDHSEEEHGHSHSSDIDPHTWVSPKSALILAQNVKDSLVLADKANADVYTANYEVVLDKIKTLDNQYTAELGKAKQRNMVVSHHAFGYLARDYNLKQTAIMGINPDAEPRAQDIIKIAKFVKENDVKYIFFEELVSDQLATMLASEAKVKTMVLNPLEGLTKEQEKAGETYLNLMQHNLQNLMQALQ
ncbi:metal ABC transporter solute-binding protein, Zn/Mn family [Paenibacillus sp. L3-i20]|uniref:metal ABC transporter solute-binding protein, Zn/Mn family n=1 Tax=Paenibacillus sp. L3-i20 TaxID=2905833 RepID=UPI001EDD6197|nr:zinc ABC transporter substrate-binding protein [Paenibacillus sp. L3-i20]GKU79674.1 ABC transporter substrate-binding protein [Paenibacillus sp. L3-i20]